MFDFAAGFHVDPPSDGCIWQSLVPVVYFSHCTHWHVFTLHRELKFAQIGSKWGEICDFLTQLLSTFRLTQINNNNKLVCKMVWIWSSFLRSDSRVSGQLWVCGMLWNCHSPLTGGSPLADPWLTGGDMPLGSTVADICLFCMSNYWQQFLAFVLCYYLRLSCMGYAMFTTEAMSYLAPQLLCLPPKWTNPASQNVLKYDLKMSRIVPNGYLPEPRLVCMWPPWLVPYAHGRDRWCFLAAGVGCVFDLHFFSILTANTWVRVWNWVYILKIYCDKTSKDSDTLSGISLQLGSV